VLRVANTALRFRPTAELFAALGQPEPEPVATSGAPVTATRAAGTTGARRSANAGNGGFARVWVLRSGTLQAVRVRTGVTDGALTAIVEGELKDGDPVVTAVTDQATASTATTTGSPLLPFGRRGGAGANGARGAGAQR
jgi:HlyD family secretion protein